MDDKENITFRFKEPLLICAAAKVFTWAVLIICAALVWGMQHFGITIKHTVINWDAIWYLKIAMEGYSEPRKMVFFPLFPAFIKLFSFVIRDPAWAALAAANLFGFTAAVSLYNLALKNFNKTTAAAACLIFFAAPTALFFTSAYTEPLFLTLSCMFFMALSGKKWLTAAVFAGAASCCRNTGALLAAVFVFEYFRSERDKPNFMRAAGYLLICVSGLAGYMVFLYLRTGDPLYFISVQGLWHDRARIVFPLSEYFRSVSGIFSGAIAFNEKGTILSAVYFTAALIFIYPAFRKIGAAQLLYYMAFVIFLSTQPSMMSFSRYLASIPQFWIIPAACISGEKPGKIPLFAVVLSLLAWQLVIDLRWIAGFWVA